MTNQSSALNTIKVQESANYLADLFMEIENGGKEDATNTETAAYTAMDETLRKLRKRVCNGTYVEEWAASSFMYTMRFLLPAADEAGLIEDQDHEGRLHMMIAVEDRQDLCNELLHQLDEYVHNYRSTRITA